MKPESSTPEDLTKIITIKEARAIGAEIKEEYPVKKCEYCGKELQPVGRYINLFDKKRWLSRGEYERCTCSKAQEHWVRFDAEQKKTKDAELKKEQEKAYQEKLDRLLKQSKLGDRFKNRTFENFIQNNDNQQAYKTAKKYADEFEKYKKQGIGLIFTGTYGTGKTHLAAAICLELIRKGRSPIFGTTINLLEKIKATYDDDYSKENEEKVINQYINCDLLIIDDLGKEKPTEWAISTLYYVINSRYEKNLPLIITSNYNIETLKKRLTVKDNEQTAEAIVSRLYEMCKGVDMEFEDYRKMI